MRTASIFVIALLAPVAYAGAQVAPRPGGAAPSASACTTTTPDCTEWVALGAGPARSLIYTSRPLGKPNPNVRRALVMVHGTNRNADHYFSTAVAAAFLAGALEDAVVIAPRIASAAGNCHDK